jgi:hypothetical protein
MKLRHLAAALAFAASFACSAQPVQKVRELAASEQPKFLDTLKSLVEIESGSTNRAGLDKLSPWWPSACVRWVARWSSSNRPTPTSTGWKTPRRRHRASAAW